MKIMFEVKGKPQGKQRPRILKSGHRFTPKKTTDYEQLVKLKYLEAAKGFKFEKDVPLEIEIQAAFKPPKTVSKKIRLEMLEDKILPTKKPDVDNIAKIILDALNGVAYHDDSQVIFLRLSKYYLEESRVLVCIQNLD